MFGTGFALTILRRCGYGGHPSRVVLLVLVQGRLRAEALLGLILLLVGGCVAT